MKRLFGKLGSAFVLLFVASITAQARYTYTSLNAPLGVFGTWALGISGNNIVGYYEDANAEFHGFLHDGSSWRTLDDPVVSSGAYGTHAWGISGNNIVGYYPDASGYHGFLYNGSSWTALDDPLEVYGTYAFGVSDNDIVGYYDDGHIVHGFLATPVPEPSALALAGLGAISLLARSRK